MMLNKKKTLLRLCALILCAVMVLPLNVLAAQPETAEPLASDIFQGASGWISTHGNGNIKINFTVRTGSTMTKLGVSGITLYEAESGEDWLPVKTYYSRNIPSMLGSNCKSYSSNVSYSGTVGYRYQAHITFYAQTTSGSETTLYWTTVVVAL